MAARLRTEELNSEAEVLYDPDLEQAPPRRVTRQTRKPFGSTDQKLAFPKRDGYHRHWFNDEPGRIYQAKEAGYDHVADSDGRPASRVVGVNKGGGPLLAYLMEIPVAWWNEDMERGQVQIDEKEKGIKRGMITKADPKDQLQQVFYAGSDKGQIDIHDSFSRPRH